MATLPVFRPLRVHQGNTKRIPFQWYTSPARTAGIDKSGCTYEGSIETLGGVVIAVATFDLTGASGGRVEAIFDAADTADLTDSGDYVYDVVETNEDGDVTTLVTGPVEVTLSVTQ